eukprot:GEMP01085379.1.p1 GENE.GEMP01085379.1~~GEMP01085379.1.p1  ORF type:complete len:131 (-),score=0.39 GEMP01085379.1:246-638(-)
MLLPRQTIVSFEHMKNAETLPKMNISLAGFKRKEQKMFNVNKILTNARNEPRKLITLVNKKNAYAHSLQPLGTTTKKLGSTHIQTFRIVRHHCTFLSSRKVFGSIIWVFNIYYAKHFAFLEQQNDIHIKH